MSRPSPAKDAVLAKVEAGTALSRKCLPSSFSILS